MPVIRTILIIAALLLGWAALRVGGSAQAARQVPALALPPSTGG